MTVIREMDDSGIAFHVDVGTTGVAITTEFSPKGLNAFMTVTAELTAAELDAVAKHIDEIRVKRNLFVPAVPDPEVAANREAWAERMRAGARNADQPLSLLLKSLAAFGEQGNLPPALMQRAIRVAEHQIV